MSDHAEVLRHMKETIKAIMPSEVEALDAAIAALSAPPSAPVWVDGLVERMRQAPSRLWRADLVGQQISVERMRDIFAFALAQQPAVEYERQQPCGCVLCVCEDEKQCHGCGAKHCGNHTDHPAYVTRDLAAEAERKFFSRDYYEEAREGKKPWPGQQPAADGEEIMVNAAHDVYTLPLQPSGLSSGPRFVVHVPGPEQPAAVDGVADFEIHAGGEYFASVGGPRERAWKEAMHYVSTLHPDDGEPEVFEVTRRKVDIAAQPGGSDNDR